MHAMSFSMFFRIFEIICILKCKNESLYSIIPYLVRGELASLTDWKLSFEDAAALR